MGYWGRTCSKGKWDIGEETVLCIWDIGDSGERAALIYIVERTGLIVHGILDEGMLNTIIE